MLLLAFCLLLTAAILGVALAVLHLRGGFPPFRIAGALHGVLGAAGLVALLPALRGPPRGKAMGVAGFGTIAAVLFAVALLLGLALLAGRRRISPIPLIGMHATLAVGGIVILAAYMLMG